MSAAKEVTYLQDRNVLVTNTRAIMAGRAFAMANVTSVSISKTTSYAGIYSLGVGVFGAMGGFICAASSEPFSFGALFLGIVFCAAFVILGWLLLSSENRTTYTVIIGSSGGEVNALASKDQAYIQTVVAAVNAAIIQRG